MLTTLLTLCLLSVGHWVTAEISELWVQAIRQSGLNSFEDCLIVQSCSHEEGMERFENVLDRLQLPKETPRFSPCK